MDFHSVMYKGLCTDGKRIFSVGLCMSSVGRFKNYECVHLTRFCFLMIGISTRFSNTANMEGTEAIWVSLLAQLLVCCVIFFCSVLHQWPLDFPI